MAVARTYRWSGSDVEDVHKRHGHFEAAGRKDVRRFEATRLPRSSFSAA